MWGHGTQLFTKMIWAYSYNKCLKLNGDYIEKYSVCLRMLSMQINKTGKLTFWLLFVLISLLLIYKEKEDKETTVRFCYYFCAYHAVFFVVEGLIFLSTSASFYDISGWHHFTINDKY